MYGRKANFQFALRVQQFVFQRVLDEFGTVRQAQFLHNAFAIGFDRARRERELIADLAARESFRGERKHLPLAFRERVETRFRDLVFAHDGRDAGGLQK